jgi:hypothetical protein
MSIQVNANAGAVSWEQLLSSLGDVQKTDSVEGKQSFTITSNVDGEVRTVTVSVPDDLEIPGEVDQTTLNGLVDKLAATGLGFTDEHIAQMKDAIADMYKALEGATSEVAAKSKGHALFDLYALMALMIEVAQSQRDAAREMRTSENIVVQNSIQNQADEQRAAARVGMIVGISCGIASMAVSIGTMIGQSFAASSQSKIMAQSGAESAKMHANMLQNTDNPAHAQQQLQTTMANVGDETAMNVVGKFESRVNDAQVGNLRNNLNEASLRVETAKEALPARQEELETAQTQLAEKQAAVDQAQAEYDAHPNKAALEAARAKQQYIREEMSAGREPSPAKIAEYDATIGNADLESARAASANLNKAKQELAAAQQDVQTKQGNVRIAQEEVTNATTALDKARSDYASTVRSVAEDYQAKYQEAIDRQANPPEGATKQELADNVAKAKAEMEMAFAVEADLLAKDGVMSPTMRSDMMKELHAKQDVAVQTTYQRTDFKAYDRRMTTLMGINNINGAIGNVLQSTASNLSSLRSAEATRTGAETKKQEEMLDQTKDLFSQEQKLIDQVIQLFSSVIQTENQSMRDAIQA